MYSYTTFLIFFFNDTATTEIYTLSLHDALPILLETASQIPQRPGQLGFDAVTPTAGRRGVMRFIEDKRSEEHTSELQSQSNLVCRLLLEKKKKKNSKYLLIITTCRS